MVFFAHENPVIIANTSTLPPFAWSGEIFGSSTHSISFETVVGYPVLTGETLTMTKEGSLTKVLTTGSNPVGTWLKL